MHLSLAAIIVVVPLLASATPLAQSPRVTIPISKTTNLHRNDGSLDVEALKRSVAASTEYVIFLLDRLIYDLTSSIVRSFVASIRTNRTLANATPSKSTTTSATLVKAISRISLAVTKNFGMVRMLKLL